MKALAALATLCVAIVTSALPAAAARDSYVQDGAALFSAATVAQLNAKSADLAQQTGKEVVVITVPTVGTETPQAAAERAFATQRVNGVLIFITKAEKKDVVLRDRASRVFFPTGTLQTIHDAMRGYFRSGDFDNGILTGVQLAINTYRGHLNSLPRQHAYAPAPNAAQPAYAQQSGGFHMGWFWWLVIIIAAFLIIRAIIRAMMAPRMMPPGGPGYGQPGYGQPMGYGGGMGGMGGGGGFWAGMLGGLGGAFLGNELFGRHDGGSIGGGDQAGIGGGYNNPDSSGWQNDGGQADTSDMGGGGFGDSGGGGFDGGGFDGGGGGGDW